MKNIRHNFFAQFAVLSLGTLAIFATVIGFVLNAEDAEYIELFQKHVEMMETGDPIDPDSDYSVPSILEHFQNHQQNDIIAVSAGFIVLYIALTLIVWVGWRYSRQDERELQIANESLLSSDASVRKMADERAAVAELGRIATSAPDMRDIYEIFASRVGSLVPFSMLSINLVDDETHTFTTRYVTGENTSHHLQGKDMPIAGTFVEPLQNGRSAILFQPDSPEEVKDAFPSLVPSYNHGFRSYLGVALISGNRRIGSLQWQSTGPSTYSKTDFTLAEQIGSQIAGALANSQLHTDLERESDDREALAEIGRIISSSLAIEDVYERFAESVSDLIPWDRIVINVINADNKTYKNTYLSGMNVKSQIFDTVLPLAGTQSELVAKTKVCNLVQSENVEEMLSAFPRLTKGIKAGLRSFLCVPLISNEQIIGTLNLRAIQTNAYSDRHVNLTERVATQIAGAISNAQLHAQLDHEAYEREVLANIGRVISASIDINEVYDRFATHVSSILPFDNLSISIVDEENGKSTVTYSSASSNISKRRLGDVHPLIGSLSGYVVGTRCAKLVDEATPDQIAHEFPGLERGFSDGIRSFLGVPLIHGDSVVAVLQLRSLQPKVYTDHHVSLAERVGNQIAGAIANAQLHTDLERESRERDVLAQIGRIMSSSLAIEEVYERFADLVRTNIPSDRIVINILNLEALTFRNVHISGMKIAQQDIGNPTPIEGTQLQSIIDTGTSRLLQGGSADETVEAYPAYAPFVKVGLRSFLDVPLRTCPKLTPHIYK